MGQSMAQGQNHSVSISSLVFNTWRREVSEFIIDKHGASYSTWDDIGNSWRYKFPYSDEIRADLIAFSHNYIARMDCPKANANQPLFLKKLVKKMADYLSAYTVRRICPANTPRQQVFAMREAECVDLESALYDQCQYIQGLLSRQATILAQRQKPRDPAVLAQKRRDFAATQRYQKQITDHVNHLFREAQTYKR